MKVDRQRLRAEVFALLGNRCANPDCAWTNKDGTRGCTDPRCLQIDHKHGGGYRANRKAGGNFNHLKEILRTPDVHEHYQLLCANCNWIKRHENREWNYGGTEESQERQRQVRDTLIEHPELTQKEIGQKFRVSKRTVQTIAHKFGVWRGKKR